MTPPPRLEQKEAATRLFNKYGNCIIKESTCEHIVEDLIEMGFTKSAESGKQSKADEWFANDCPVGTRPPSVGKLSVEWPEKVHLKGFNSITIADGQGYNRAIDACIAAYEAAQPVKTWSAAEIEHVLDNLISADHDCEDTCYCNFFTTGINKAAQAIADLVNGGKR